MLARLQVSWLCSWFSSLASCGMESVVRWLRGCDVDEEGVDLALAMGLQKVRRVLLH